MSIITKLKIINAKGLHARASAKLAERADQFDATAIVRHDGMEANANSIMGLLMLAAAHGTTIEVETHGVQALELSNALADLVNGRFGEDQ